MWTLSNSAVATMGFTVEDKHSIKWLSVSGKYKAKHFYEMFSDRGQSLNERKTRSTRSTQ